VNNKVYTIKYRPYCMKIEHEQALKLRLSGKSYTEIQKILGTPKSTLSGWLSHVIIADEHIKQIALRTKEKSLAGLLKHNKNQTLHAIRRTTAIRRKAQDEVVSLDNKKLLVLGAALYWAEGYKRPMVRNGRTLTSHAVSLTNSDSVLIRAFLCFLRRYCAVPEEKIKASLRIFPHQNELEILSFWQKETGIPRERFGKTYRGVSKASMHKRPFNRLPYGIIQVHVADTNLFHRIMGHIEGIKDLV